MRRCGTIRIHPLFLLECSNIPGMFDPHGVPRYKAEVEPGVWVCCEDTPNCSVSGVCTAMAPCTAPTKSLMTVVFVLSSGRKGDSFFIPSIPGHGCMARPRTCPAADQREQRWRLAVVETRLLLAQSSSSNGDVSGDGDRANAHHAQVRIQPGDGGMRIRSSTPTQPKQ